MAAAFGLYSHIQSNKRRSIALLLGLFFLIYLMVFAGALAAHAIFSNVPLTQMLIGAWDSTIAALPYATSGTFVWMGIAYAFNTSMIDALTGGHEVTRTQQPRLYNLLENLCISRGIPMPRLKLMQSDALNAFASGVNQEQYAITVTTALDHHLDDDEMEAVLAHELTHIMNGDVRMMVIAVIIAGVIGFVAELVFRWMFRGGFGSRSSSSSNNREKGGGTLGIIIAIALVALAWLLSIAIRFALSRKREYLADAGAVELTKKPDAMIMALRKIENRGELEGATSSVMEMCVDNPRSGFADLFATHPAIDDRIAALIAHAGGRDPGPIALPDRDETPDESGEGIATETAAEPTSPPKVPPIGMPPDPRNPTGVFMPPSIPPRIFGKRGL